jgi:uncharacterized phage-associated protein
MNIEAPHFQFNRELFKDVVHYVCASCPPDKLGNVKLHKVLYFADMLFYVKRGRPITGASYQKQRFGPTAPYLSAALKELEKESRLKIEDAEFFGFRKKQYRSLRDPDTSRIGTDERQFIDVIIKFVCHDHSAKQISELSHTEAWEVARLGEELPYYTAFSLFPVEITDEDVAWGTAEAEGIVSRGLQPSSV